MESKYLWIKRRLMLFKMNKSIEIYAVGEVKAGVDGLDIQ